MNYVVNLLLQPMVLLSLVLGLAIANLWRKRVEKRRRLLWVTIPLALLVILCTSAVSTLITGPLEWPYQRLHEFAQQPEALVVLSGSARPIANDDPELALGPETYYRCQEALALYRRGGEPWVVVSGGLAEEWPGTPPMAEVMRDYLVRQGVRRSRILVEGKSRDTHENAVESCRLLREHGVHSIVLVTDARHMWRAAACFQKEGMEVQTGPCNFITAQFANTLAEYLPSPAGAHHLQQALHEWVGLLYYRVRGWN